MKIANLNTAQIFYSANSENAAVEHEFAHWLRQKLHESCDMELTVSTDAADTTKPAILLGALSGLAPEKLQYAVQVRENNVLALAAGSTAAYDALIEHLLSKAEKGEEIQSCEGSCLDVSLQKRHGDLRILFHNIFGYDRKPTINPQRRYLFESILYREYDADILCLQEYDGGPRKYLTPLLTQNGFTEVPADQMGFPKNCSPIFYNAERVELLDHGFFPFTYKSEVCEMVCNNHDTKNLTWAAFVDRKTEKKFLVISVHFYYSPDASGDMTNRVESNKARIENAKELFSYIQNHIYTKNGGEFAGLPVLWGGDLNCSFNDQNYPSLIASANGKTALAALEEMGMKHAQKHAEIFADNVGSYCWFPTYDEELGYYNSCGRLDNKTFNGSIDHSYVYGDGVTPLTFDILDTTIAKKSSDHAPIVVDYRFD